MPASPSSGPRLSLFVTVLSLFLMVALLVGTAVTITNYIEARKTAVKSAADVFHATINQINERRLAFFAPVFLIADQLHHAPSFQQADGSKEPILPLVLSSLKSNPQISAAYAGYENGNYFQVLSISDAEKPFVARLGGPPLTRYAIEEIRVDNNGVRNVTWRFLDGDNHEIAKLADNAATYDPRRRGWYREALERPKNII